MLYYLVGPHHWEKSSEDTLRKMLFRWKFGETKRRTPSFLAVAAIGND